MAKIGMIVREQKAEYRSTQYTIQLHHAARGWLHDATEIVAPCNYDSCTMQLEVVAPCNPNSSIELSNELSNELLEIDTHTQEVEVSGQIPAFDTEVGESDKKPKKNLKAKAKKVETTSRPFEDFWSIWPRKVAKAEARKAWQKLNPDDALLQTILAAVERQKTTWTDPRYIPHPATWLRGERWEDETNVVPINVPKVRPRLYGFDERRVAQMQATGEDIGPDYPPPVGWEDLWAGKGQVIEGEVINHEEANDYAIIPF